MEEKKSIKEDEKLILKHNLKKFNENENNPMLDNINIQKEEEKDNEQNNNIYNNINNNLNNNLTVDIKENKPNNEIIINNELNMDNEKKWTMIKKKII